MFLLFLLAIPFPLMVDAADFHDVQWHSCHDGDTCTVTILGVHPFFGKEIRVRLAGIQTPEMEGKCYSEIKKAIEARNYLAYRLRTAKKIVLKEVERGKFFRIVATIVVDGVDLCQELLRTGYAVIYNEDEKYNWCN